MQNYCKTIGALAAASALVAGTASAEVEYEIHTGYTSEYLFRGLNLGQDLVEVGVDVSTEINNIGLSAGAWYGSFSSGPNGLVDIDELDLYGEASYDFGFLTGAIGYIHYDLLRGGANAQEVYFSVGRDFGFVEASLTYFWDVQTDNDGYMELELSRGFELSSCLTLSCSSKLGYLAEEGDFVHLTGKVALDYAFTETATLSPFIAGSLGLNDAGTHAGNKNQFVAGTMLSVSF